MITNIIEIYDCFLISMKVPMVERATIPSTSKDGLVGDVGVPTSPTRHGPEGAREAEG